MASLDVRGATATASARAMASVVRVTLDAAGHSGDAAAACEAALEVFRRVELECSRFDPASDLSRVNAAPDRWHRVGPYCALALSEAWDAYRLTEGRFDPRVLGDLVGLGYDRWPPRPTQTPDSSDAPDSPDAPDPSDPPDPSARPTPERPPRAPWRPRFGVATRRVHVDGWPVDLGGIGKGLAVRWASQTIGRPGHLVDAGGDCLCAGTAPDGGPWRVGIEDPAGGDRPLAVLALSDLACTTSSVRRRRWVAAGRPVHHLIDPSTGLPGGTGLLAVTVIAADPAVAEVWSKVLFLRGADAVEGAAERHGLAACWVTDDGGLHVNDRALVHVVWRR